MNINELSNQDIIDIVRLIKMKVENIAIKEHGIVVNVLVNQIASSFILIA